MINNESILKTQNGDKLTISVFKDEEGALLVFEINDSEDNAHLNYAEVGELIKVLESYKESIK